MWLVCVLCLPLEYHPTTITDLLKIFYANMHPYCHTLCSVRCLNTFAKFIFCNNTWQRTGQAMLHSGSNNRNTNKQTVFQSNELANFEQSLPRVDALDKVNEQNLEIINQIAPSLKKSFNLAAYVNQSDTLQQLFKLGVNISKMDKHHKLASYIVRADFKQDIQPYILFLTDCGVATHQLAEVFNRNPFLLTIPLEDLECRKNYFLFKKFTQTDVASILVRAANIFNLHTKTIDTRLGNLSKEYALLPTELRHVICLYPRILETLDHMLLKQSTFMFAEEMGFSPEEIKSILLTNPILWRKCHKFSGHSDFLRVFDYVHNEMGVPHTLIAKNALILTWRVSLIRPRDQYLKVLDRAQYDPCKPLYVPLTAFYQLDDNIFCEKYAKTSVHDFNAFLKTL